MHEPAVAAGHVSETSAKRQRQLISFPTWIASTKLRPMLSSGVDLINARI
jgi:hypothetical protein